MRAALSSEPIDLCDLEGIMIRWHLADDYLFRESSRSETGKQALKALISRDFPILVRELTRLRPELV